MKAIFYNKNTGDVVEVVENVTDYDSNGVVGNSVIQGISDHIGWKLFEDNVIIDLLKKIDEYQEKNLKPDEDYKKKIFIMVSERNKRLADSDYLLMSDYPITEKQKIKIMEYRQALRDFPTKITKNNINDISLPEKPMLEK